MALEQGGVPTIAVHTQAFARLVRSVTKVSGMPTARQAFVPHPVVGVSPSVLRGYIEGEDPIQKRPFVQVMIEGLTGPFTDQDMHGVSFERSTPRLIEPDTEDNLQRLFMENNWTDFMPIILPTEERVERMLKGTSHPPDKVVGRLRPTNFREFWEFTVEKVAVNAVMAGASPEYFPVILALAASGITARSSSTTSFATIGIVNGPIRNEIGMNSGIGAMGPWNHANTSICCHKISRAAPYPMKPTWAPSATVSITAPYILKTKNAAPGNRCTFNAAPRRMTVWSPYFLAAGT